MEIQPYIAQSNPREETQSPQAAAAGVAAFGDAAGALGQFAQQAHDAEVELEVASALIQAEGRINEWLGSLNPNERMVTVNGEEYDRTESLGREYLHLTSQITNDALEGIQNRRAKQLAKSSLAQLYAKNTLAVSKAQRDLKINVLRSRSEDEVNELISQGNFEVATQLVKRMRDRGVYSADEADQKIDYLNAESSRWEFAQEFARAQASDDPDDTLGLITGVMDREKYEHLTTEQRMAYAGQIRALRNNQQSVADERLKKRQEEGYTNALAVIEDLNPADIVRLRDNGRISDNHAQSLLGIKRTNPSVNNPAFERELRGMLAVAKLPGSDIMMNQEMLRTRLHENAEQLTPTTYSQLLNEVDQLDDDRLKDFEYTNLLDRYAGKLKVVREGLINLGDTGDQNAARQALFADFERDLRRVFLRGDQNPREWAEANWENYEYEMPTSAAPAGPQYTTVEEVDAAVERGELAPDRAANIRKSIRNQARVGQ
jgi:hypothetical protein